MVFYSIWNCKIVKLFSLLYGELFIYLTPLKKQNDYEKKFVSQALPDDDSFAISPIL
jgi:hypothetical protein